MAGSTPPSAADVSVHRPALPPARREWRVRNEAVLHDPGLALAELLGLVGDLLRTWAASLNLVHGL